MKVGAFELNDPVPELRQAQAFTMLSPWIDVGEVGSATLQLLEAHFKATELGKLRRPGRSLFSLDLKGQSRWERVWAI